MRLYEGSRKDDPDDLAHHLAHRGQAPARPVPRHRPALDDDELDGRACEVDVLGAHGEPQGQSDAAVRGTE